MGKLFELASKDKQLAKFLVTLCLAGILIQMEFLSNGLFLYINSVWTYRDILKC